jgi:mitochondrial fusion and transport protein UGO1
MSSTKEGVNPLRPYYIPPRIGERIESLPRAKPFPSTSSNANATSTGYASKARDIFPDIDYKEHLDELSPSTVESIKQFVDELLWKYTSVLMSQPFEVAKTILQVRVQDDIGGLDAAPIDTNSRTSVESPRKSLYDGVCLKSRLSQASDVNVICPCSAHLDGYTHADCENELPVP